MPIVVAVAAAVVAALLAVDSREPGQTQAAPVAARTSVDVRPRPAPRAGQFRRCHDDAARVVVVRVQVAARVWSLPSIALSRLGVVATLPVLGHAEGERAVVAQLPQPVPTRPWVDRAA